jgi:class 3 adenylate cyclase/tetratricopeptide (TPR) repeat protein
VNCSACGFENPAGARFCGRCGEELGAACPSCGATVAPGLVYCTSCGARLAEPQERKVVTVLFADLVGFTRRAERLDPEDVRQVLAPYHARLRLELERFGGTVEKFIGDAVMALFGAPAAHEDDPERGVRAALAIREAIAELNAADPGLDLHVRIAVTTGEAVVALGARPSEGEGMAAGDVLNTASRLQAAAPVDGILVDAATHAATEHAVEYREAEPVVAKGKPEPIEVWEAVSPHKQPDAEALQRRRGRFVNREGELESLRGGLARAREEGSVQLVTLVGEPGIGKSRLLYEFSRAAAEEPEPAAWQLGRCLPYGEGVTFWALGEMVKGWAEILETDTAREAGRKLRRTVEAAIADATEAAWAEGHLRSLVGLAGEVESGSDRRTEAFAGWRRFLEAQAARRPLVLVFEDLHWADDGLLDFIDHLVEWASGARLLVVCTARPELLERRPGWSATRDNALTRSLSALTDSDTALLVGSLLEEIVLPDRAESALLARAGGNPLYAGEYVRMLADRGLVSPEGAEPTDGELPLPESVQAIIAARLDALPPEEKALLQDAAVIGRGFWAGALVALGGVPRWKVEELLLAVERKGFVRREPVSSVARETQYAFWHVLFRDVAYGQIPRARRAEKHRLAAAWIESLNVERAEDRAEMLAHHFVSALEYAQTSGQGAEPLAERASSALRDAGDRAAGLGAFAPAVRFYGAALEHTPSDAAERPLLLFRLGQARFHGEAAGAETLAEACQALLESGDVETAAEAIVMLGELDWTAGDTERAFRSFEEAAELLAEAPGSRAKAHVLGSMARFLMVSGRYEEAIRVGFEALRMADELGHEELRAHALDSIGVARAAIGDPGGLVDLEQSIAIAVELNSLEAVRGYINLGTTLAELGELDRAFELYERGRRAAEGFGDRDRMRWFEAERLYELYWRGSWNEAVRGADELIADEETTSPHTLHDCRMVRGAVRLARGDTAGALADAAWALQFARGADYPEALFPALAFDARARLAVGQEEEAGALAGELLERWAGAEGTAASFWTADLARVLWLLGRGEELRPVAARVRAPTRWLEAAQCFAAGELEEAADLYAEIGTRPDEAFARICAGGRETAADRSEDRGQLQRALAFYDEVGATAVILQTQAPHNRRG